MAAREKAGTAPRKRLKQGGKASGAGGRRHVLAMATIAPPGQTIQRWLVWSAHQEREEQGSAAAANPETSEGMC